MNWRIIKKKHNKKEEERIIIKEIDKTSNKEVQENLKIRKMIKIEIFNRINMKIIKMIEGIKVRVLKIKIEMMELRWINNKEINRVIKHNKHNIEEDKNHN